MSVQAVSTSLAMLLRGLLVQVLCCGASQKSHPPLLALASSATSEAGRQRRSQKASLEFCQKDWLAALTPLQRLANEPTTANDKLVEGVSGPIMTEGTMSLIDPGVFVFGIDPDVSGAMAVLRGDDVTMAEVIDVPTVRIMVGSRYRRRHDPSSLANIIKELSAPKGSVAYIEQNSPLPKDGKQGWWGSGFGYGIWIGTLVASGISVIPVSSVAWKRAMGLAGKDVTKDGCRACASLIFPSLASRLNRKKDHGRAEALLIAAYGIGMPVPSNLMLARSEMVFSFVLRLIKSSRVTSKEMTA
ncbi:hypothetical protein GOP47_0023056 [Adiantum capillus-veneris]|uniref:Uncharacterized protein n=1 Tax=Adiantum capillus-veneris TaxID=13818 RepID=A0A9D4U7N3_ADICA|nr:hypothetical protein GOP47_0023056 [Adiantum capillus-veneris]